jgi:selenocysteine lyase/cysteine desulfurase
MMQNEDDHILNCKKRINEIYNADIDEIGLVPNYSIGMNFLLDAIPKNANVLLIDTDYPSVNLPVRSKLNNIYEVYLSVDIEDKIEEKIKSHQIDYVICSLVQYLNGVKLNQNSIAEIKKNHQNLRFIIDATQYMGTERFDFAKSSIDAIGTSGYKWLNAGLGNGFFLIKKDFREQLYTSSIGSNSQAYKPDGPFTPTGFLEPGHLDLIAFHTLEEALKFHYKDIGIDLIEYQVNKLSQQLKDGLAERGLLEDMVIKRNVISPIYSINAGENLFHFLQKNKVKCAMRGGNIRIGVNYFNSIAEIDQFLSILRSNR